MHKMVVLAWYKMNQIDIGLSVTYLQQLADYRGTEQTYHTDLTILLLEHSCLEVEAATIATQL